MAITLIVKPNKLLLKGCLMYWMTNFLYTLSQDNPEICAKLKGVEELDSFIQQGINSLDQTNIHICANLVGLSANMYLSEFGIADLESDVFRNYIQTPLTQILAHYSSPQQEFTTNFSENLESIKESLSSANECSEMEEAMGQEKPPPSNEKLAQIFTNFLNEMSVQVSLWKNYAIGNNTAMEVLKEIVAFEPENEGNLCIVLSISYLFPYSPKRERNQIHYGSTHKSNFKEWL